jgi:DNA polymerase-1
MGGHKDESEEELERVEKRIAEARKNSDSNQGCLFDDSEPALDAAVREPEVTPLRFAYALMDTDIRDRYCARDTVATARLGDLLDKQVTDDEGASHVWQSVGRRATDAIAQMERWGMAADRSAVQSLQEILDLELGQVQARLSSYGDFNPASPADVAKLLFGKLGLRSTEKTNGGKPSTASDVLERLRGKHPVVEDLLYHRRLAKYKGDYGDKLGRYIRNDGRIHCEIKIDGTRTGRASVKEPPLHGLPQAIDELSRAVKRCFVAPPGCLIVVADYSQIELRIAAMLSGDPVMRDMFISGEDFHTATAKLIARNYWGIDPSAVGKKERSSAKTFNFALLYGMSDNGLAKRLGTSVQEAKRLRAAIMGAWKVLARWIDQRKKEARETGYCWTWWAGKRARKRPLFGIRSKDRRQKSTAENSAVNTPVQGTANEYMVASICETVEWIWAENRPERLGLTVHDSVVAEVPIDTLHEFVGTVREIMLGHDSGDVPLKVDIEVGTTYGDLEPYEEGVGYG